MKKALLLLFSLVVIGSEAQTIVVSGAGDVLANGTYYLDVSGGASPPLAGLFLNANGSGYVVGGGGGLPGTTTNDIAVSDGYSAIYYTTNMPANPTNGYVHATEVWGTGSNPPPALTFYLTGGSPTAVIVSVAPVSLWPSAGGRVTLFAKGFQPTNAMITLTLGSNVIYRSELAQSSLWQMQGQLDLDASNTLSCGINFSGQASQLTVVSNFVASNAVFSVNADAFFPTNISVTKLTLTGQQAVDGYQPVLEWPPGQFMQPYTITNSTDSTFGYGAGMMAWDTNYVYVSWGTNRWKRAALSSY